MIEDPKNKGLDISNGMTVEAWHKDGVIYKTITDENGKQIEEKMGNVYINGTIANTDGEYEHVAITLDGDKQDMLYRAGTQRGKVEHGETEQVIEIQPFKKYKCQLNFRPVWKGGILKPNLYLLNGLVIDLQYAWTQDEDDKYPGEIALTPVDQRHINPHSILPGWISSGDVTVIQEL